MDRFMDLRRIQLVLVACVATTWAAPRARADAGQDVAAAESLFREAKELMRQGRYPEACPKLEASQRLDPSTGTLLNLADCHERTGKTASAWAEYSSVVTLARRAGQSEREKVASEAVARISLRLVKLSVVVPAPARVEGLEVERDGSAIVPAMYGTALPVDPGPHRVQAKAPGKQPWEKEVELTTEGSTITVSVPVLEDLPRSTAAPMASPDRAPLPSPMPASHPTARSHQSTWGLLLGGVGLAGLAVSGALAMSARAQWTDAGCSRGHCPNESSQRLADTARTRADFATASFVGGVVLLGAGTLLVLTAPRSTPEEKAPSPPESLALSATLAPREAALSLNGRF
jgi:hypothetical protein